MNKTKCSGCTMEIPRKNGTLYNGVILCPNCLAYKKMREYTDRVMKGDEK